MPNLIVVAITQVLLGIILYSFIPFRSLSGWTFGLLILTTIFIAAAGYVINDIYDSEIDLINKPQKVVVGKSIPLRKAYQHYWTIVFLGFGIALYLAGSIHDFKQLLIYPFATLLLWAYAKYFKKSFIIGNLIIAAYCAFVPGIILYAERLGFNSLSEKSSTSFILNIFMSYAVMAFLTTAWREVIKDMEDITGDQAHGAQTLPVLYGLSLSQKVANTLGSIVLVLIIYYLVFLFSSRNWNNFSYLLLVGGLVLKIIYATFRSLTVADLHRSSQLIKLVMVLGLGYLFFLI